VGIFLGFDCLENLVGSNLNLVKPAEQALKHPHLLPDKNDKKYFMHHFTKNKKKNKINHSYEKSGTLGKRYKRLTEDGIIVLRNPCLPSPDIYSLEIVILEKFKANKHEKHKLLVQDKLILNKLKFGQNKNILYELESGNVLELNLELNSLDKRGKARILKSINKYEQKMENEESLLMRKKQPNQLINFRDQLNQMGLLVNPSNQNNEDSNLKIMHTGGGTGVNIPSNNMPSNQSNPIKVEMTGGINFSGLDKNNTSNIIKNNNHNSTKNEMMVQQENKSNVSEMESEIDILLEDLYEQVKHREKEKYEEKGIKQFNFNIFDTNNREKEVFSLKKVLWMIKKRIIIEEMKNEELKKLELLRQPTVEMILQNINSFDYLVDLVPKYDDLKYIKGRIFIESSQQGNITISFLII
jgi:hypothetical protein